MISPLEEEQDLAPDFEPWQRYDLHLSYIVTEGQVDAARESVPEHWLHMMGIEPSISMSAPISSYGQADLADKTALFFQATCRGQVDSIAIAMLDRHCDYFQHKKCISIAEVRT